MKIFNAIAAITLTVMIHTVVSANAAPIEVERELFAPQLKGKHTARYWGFKLFNAELWTNGTEKFTFDQQFALTLNYFYPFSSKFLAWSSVQEIARVEGSSPEKYGKLERQLRECLVAVHKGMRITGVADSADTMVMYVNGHKSCTLHYPNLRERFFGIWLAPTSRDARGALRLRGAY